MLARRPAGKKTRKTSSSTSGPHLGTMALPPCSPADVAPHATAWRALSPSWGPEMSPLTADVEHASADFSLSTVEKRRLRDQIAAALALANGGTPSVRAGLRKS
jgi:hypothetical protein